MHERIPDPGVAEHQAAGQVAGEPVDVPDLEIGVRVLGRRPVVPDQSLKPGTLEQHVTVEVAVGSERDVRHRSRDLQRLPRLDR